MNPASSSSRPKVIPELVLVTVLYGLYRLGRLLANGNLDEAFDNAAMVWDWERTARLPDEASVQALILHSETLQRAANVFYTSVHFPATLAFLLWMFYRHPAHYVWMRRTLTLLTGAALILHLTFPLAPPRMISAFGLVDTGRTVGPSPYDEIDTDGLANQFAAMPSLHVGWAMVVAIGLITVARTRWRWLWLVHPALTLFVVVSTANHYWLDALIAAALLGLTLLLIRPPARTASPSPAQPSAAGHPDDASEHSPTPNEKAPEDLLLPTLRPKDPAEPA
ncbi:PAP2 superfamily protein [Thermomonospora echinospora]|uniref:PAP2 superfamily protein n=1 Tax=Thermomonospora echinospora TaxID=1992 RepID=A0A1H6CPY0_9ACTN|nr:phosphatase PAP2 family protein [Thermomonospora echinospora]SEG74506.1 PAP2 superfamily protein [Thermomonospora echinospora]